jgi:hypothetical protein
VNDDQVLEEQARQLREEGRFFLEGMHPSERRQMCVRVTYKAAKDGYIEFFITEVDDNDEPVRAKEAAEKAAVHQFFHEREYTVHQVVRVAFDPRACTKCGSKKHPLDPDGACSSEWGCNLRVQRRPS